MKLWKISNDVLRSLYVLNFRFPKKNQKNYPPYVDSIFLRNFPLATLLTATKLFYFHEIRYRIKNSQSQTECRFRKRNSDSSIIVLSVWMNSYPKLTHSLSILMTFSIKILHLMPFESVRFW